MQTSTSRTSAISSAAVLGIGLSLHCLIEIVVVRLALWSSWYPDQLATLACSCGHLSLGPLDLWHGETSEVPCPGTVLPLLEDPPMLLPLMAPPLLVSVLPDSWRRLRSGTSLMWGSCFYSSVISICQRAKSSRKQLSGSCFVVVANSEKKWSRSIMICWIAKVTCLCSFNWILNDSSFGTNSCHGICSAFRRFIFQSAEKLIRKDESNTHSLFRCRWKTRSFSQWSPKNLDAPGELNYLLSQTVMRTIKPWRFSSSVFMCCRLFCPKVATCWYSSFN